MPSDHLPPAFDLIGERYEAEFAERTEQERALAWMVEQLRPGGRVLDLGCGSGYPAAVRLAGAGMSVVGVDESARMVELARERVPTATFRHGDMRELSSDLGVFDGASAFFSLLMLGKSEIRRLLRDLRARLRGPAPLAVAMVEGDYDRLPLSFLGVEIPTTAYPPAALVEEVSDAGFRVHSSWGCQVTLEPERVERQLFLLATTEQRPM